jgi:CheY-like chemotaxis protein
MKRILVIDDDRVSLAVTGDMLRDAGFEVETADSALAANEYIYGPTQPDVILMDVMMPFLDGGTKVELLRKREASRSIPVILISAKPAGELEAIADKSGADGFLTKPLDRSDLVAMIRRNS